MTPVVKALFEAARAAREKAYAPYSGHKVGAAILDTSGRTYVGCNVENSSFGATCCAERVAMQKAVSEQGDLAIAEVMVVTDATPAWPPCGVCRQVIAEFVQGRDVPVHSSNLKGEVLTMGFAELLPRAFTPEHLLKK